MFGGRNDSLPTTMGGGSGGAVGPRNNNNNRTLLMRMQNAFSRRNSQDGSAQSIHVTPPIVQSWKRSSTTVKRTYQAALGFLILLYVGYRTIRYQNAYIHVNCHSTQCNVRVQPSGWQKATELNLAREQLIMAMPVKTLKDGTFVTDQGVSTSDYQRETGGNQKKKKKKNKKSSNYKGPDPDGHYISYQILLKDSHKIAEPEDDDAAAAVDNTKSKTTGNIPRDDNTFDVPPVSLVPLLPYLQTTNEAGEYRLILRQFRVAQSRRRVRTMTQKISSYIKRRRQKLLLKENAPPSWQGIVMVVVGLIGCLLCILLGQIWSEDDQVARAKQGYQQQKRHRQVQRQRQQAVQQQQQQRGAGPGTRRQPMMTRYDASGVVRTRKRVTTTSGGSSSMSSMSSGYQ